MDDIDRSFNELLKENLAVSQESLKILKSIRRGNRIATAFKIFYWLIILGVFAGAYYFLQPYIKSALEIVQGVGQTISPGQKTDGTSASKGVQSLQDISPDMLKNLPPDLLKKLQDALNTK